MSKLLLLNIHSGGAVFTRQRKKVVGAAFLPFCNQSVLRRHFCLILFFYVSYRPQRLPDPAGANAYVESALFSLDPPENCFNAGYGLFRGQISTRVPQRGDLVRAGFANLQSPEHTQFGFLMEYNFNPYTHLIIR